MQAKPEDQIPYPVDEKLIQEALSIGNGAYVHDINCYLGEYRSWISNWNKSYDISYWFKIIISERKLRGAIHEAKSGRNIKPPWLIRK